VGSLRSLKAKEMKVTTSTVMTDKMVRETQELLEKIQGCIVTYLNKEQTEGLIQIEVENLGRLMRGYAAILSAYNMGVTNGES
jgi:hypothetical protein